MSAPDPPLVTVVVCTYGRPDALRRLLASLARLDDPRHEILVVDNGPEPGPAREEAATVGARYVHEPRRGLDRARNRGVAVAGGDIVAFIDDDCEAHPDWLTGLRRGFADPAVGCVTGRVRAASLVRPSERRFEAWFSFDRGVAVERFSRDDRRDWFPVYPSHLGTGCNMAFRREVLGRVGDFDEALDMGTAVAGGGDLDMFARVLDAGEVAVYRPDALVLHHHRTTRRALTKQFWGYGVTVGALCCKFALTRPRQRRRAVRFLQWRLGCQRRRITSRLLLRHDFPMTLIVVETVGHVWGPFAFVWSLVQSMRRPA